MFYQNLVKKISELGFDNFRKVQNVENPIYSSMDMYYSLDSLIIVKKFDNWLTLRDTWQHDQASLLDLLLNNPQYSSRFYYFMLLYNYDKK